MYIISFKIFLEKVDGDDMSDMEMSDEEVDTPKKNQIEMNVKIPNNPGFMPRQSSKKNTVFGKKTRVQFL